MNENLYHKPCISNFWHITIVFWTTLVPRTTRIAPTRQVIPMHTPTMPKVTLKEDPVVEMQMEIKTKMENF